MFRPYSAPQSHNERVCVSVRCGMTRNSSQSGAPAPEEKARNRQCGAFGLVECVRAERGGGKGQSGPSVAYPVHSRAKQYR